MSYSDYELPDEYTNHAGRLCEDDALDNDLEMYSEDEEDIYIEDGEDIHEETNKQRMQRYKFEYQSHDPKRREYIDYQLLEKLIKDGIHEGRTSTGRIKKGECIQAAMLRASKTQGREFFL